DVRSQGRHPARRVPASRARAEVLTMATKRKGGQRGNEIKGGDEKPYRVGYGRPPLETQFKPNQSGNPNGRPGRPPSWRAVVETVLEEKVEIRVGDRILRMSDP